MVSEDDNDKAANESFGKRQRMRSIAIAVALVVMVILFYVATLIRLGGNVLDKSL